MVTNYRLEVFRTVLIMISSFCHVLVHGHQSCGDVICRHLQVDILRPLFCIVGDGGSTVFKVLCYKSEGRWFDPS